MLEHRFKDFYQSQEAVCGQTGLAFVPCPMTAFAGMAPANFIQQIYVLAAERTREQMQPPRRRVPEFSMN